jgi:hypothetical protein
LQTVLSMSSSATVYEFIGAALPHFTTMPDIPARRRLRSSAGDSLDVRPSRLTTIGDRVFATAAPQI